MQPLVPVHRAALAHHMTPRRQPLPIHPQPIAAIQLRIRQARAQPQQGFRPPTAYLKISLPPAISFLYHRRPYPQLPPLALAPRLLMSPHLIPGNHRRRLNPAGNTGAALSAPPPHPGPRGARPFLTHTLTAWALTPKIRPMELNELPSRYIAIARSLIGGAGAMISGFGNVAATAIAARSRISGNKPGGLWNVRIWASSWNRIPGSAPGGDRRGGGPWFRPPKNRMA